MRRYICRLVLLSLLCNSCKKDLLQWHHVARLSSNTTDKLDNIKFLNNDVCIAAGGVEFLHSTMLRSTDGGYTFTATTDTDAPKEMYGMGVSANGAMYLCGVDGDVLRSRDQGLSWQFNRIGDWLHYFGGTFITPDTGIFVSSVLQRQGTITRIDSNFHIIDEQTFNFGMNNIYVVDANTAYLIGYGTVMKTTDRGSTWQFLNVANDNFTAMDIHGEEIWLCGYAGSVFHSTDGGQNWHRQRDGNDFTLPRYSMLDIVFKDRLNGWAVCDNGKMLYSNDGGNHWMEYDQFVTSALRSIALCPNGDVLVCGDNGNMFRLTP